MAEHIIPLRTSDFSGPAPNVEKCQCWLCANEKAALAAEIERLRAALERIADTDPDDGTAWFHNVARAALEEGMPSPDEREDCTGLEDSSTANPCGREDCEEEGRT